MIKNRITKLRDWMAHHRLSAFIIPSADPHISEYTAPVWKSREWISGFTGSAGTVVITQEEGGLWTDSRYFIQAESELKGSGLTLHRSYQKETVEDIPRWLLENLPAGSRVGIDGYVFTQAETEGLKTFLNRGSIELRMTTDPFGEIWSDRPSLPTGKAAIYDSRYTGSSASQRLQDLRGELEKRGADTLLVTPLDEIAWVLHLRGSDVTYNPVVVSYLLVGPDEATLFLDPQKQMPEVVAYLHQEGVKVRPYLEITAALKELSGCRVLLPPSKTSAALYQTVRTDRCTVLTERSPLSWMKAVRTSTEIEGIRQCMIRDGVALVRLQRWLLDALKQGEKVTEMSLDRKLYEFRSAQALFRGESFGTIAGYGPHGASPHYSATPETDAVLEPKGFLLLDSGGQYLDGTTDITRTFALGDLTEEERTDYTCVLRGHIQLALARFPKGTNGTQLDVLARAPLWEQGMLFLHGTGHGVGHYLNVHEATDVYQFRTNYMPHPLMLHSNITNEPAVYKEGRHGVRTENMMLICHDQTTEFGEFYRFETLSLCPIDTEPVLKEKLTAAEITWLNNYHCTVYERLSPHLDKEEKEWLQKKCAPLSGEGIG